MEECVDDGVSFVSGVESWAGRGYFLGKLGWDGWL